MKFYSEQLNKMFDSAEELERAEHIENTKKSEAKARIEECLVTFDAGVNSLIVSLGILDDIAEYISDEDMETVWTHMLSNLTRILHEFI